MLVGDCSAPHCDPNQLNWTVLNFVALLIHIPGACDCCDDDDDDDDDGDDDDYDDDDDDVGDDDDDVIVPFTITDLPSSLHVTQFLLKEDLKFSKFCANKSFKCPIIT